MFFKIDLEIRLSEKVPFELLASIFCFFFFFFSDWERVQPPLWLHTLMNACSQASDFSVQSVAISLVMDLVGLTQSVAVVTGENINSMESAQPLSPNQGRVAVVIRPPLTPGNLRYIAEKTEFFKVNSKDLTRRF